MKKITVIDYPDLSEVRPELELWMEEIRLRCEEGFEDPDYLLNCREALLGVMGGMRSRLERLLPDIPLVAEEPDYLQLILQRRPDTGRKGYLWETPPPDEIMLDKLLGALYARTAGCLTGVPVEGWQYEEIRDWAEITGQQFPPRDFFTRVENPHLFNCYGTRRAAYARDAMQSAPVDDDLAYTQLALLLLERHGIYFTTRDLAKLWLEKLPVACTAEDIVLKNLKAGMDPMKAADNGNPYRQWIGAAIRSDGYGWTAAGLPELAAGMAWKDAFLTHRRNGIYGAMYLAAAQSAAFGVKDPVEALERALDQVPAHSMLYGDIEWALSQKPGSAEQAVKLVRERFAGMSPVHVRNNLCLTIFGLKIGGCDPTEVVAQTVAMGMDNDCNAASAGSIVGAIVGYKALPDWMSKRFGNRMETYLIGEEPFCFDDMARRFLQTQREIYEKIKNMH